MTVDAIYQRIVDMVQEEKGVAFSLSLDSLLADTIAVDSVEVMEFVLNLEDEFGIDIPDAAIEGFASLADVVAFIASEIEKRS